MASSRQQRRRRKHKGTQAGTVKRRGRTSPRQATRESAQQRRVSRLDRPPTWRGAINRAVLAAGVFGAVLLLVLRQPVGSSIGLAAFMLLFYIPMGYAMDGFLYRVRQRRKLRERERELEQGR